MLTGLAALTAAGVMKYDKNMPADIPGADAERWGGLSKRRTTTFQLPELRTRENTRKKKTRHPWVVTTKEDIFVFSLFLRKGHLQITDRRLGSWKYLPPIDWAKGMHWTKERDASTSFKLSRDAGLPGANDLVSQGLFLEFAFTAGQLVSRLIL